MHLTSIFISGFRNLAEQSLNFSKKANWIHGPNGQGKTNLLEAIHYICLGKSFRRGTREKDLIGFNKDHALVEAKAQKGNASIHITVGFSRSGDKSIHLNGKPLQKISEFLGTLNVISFSPEDIALARGEPALRRSFMDMLISQTNPVYLKQLQEYRRALLQRNHVLRGNKNDPILLDTYTDKLVTLGALIVEERYKTISFLSEKAKNLFSRLSEKFGILEIRYQCSFNKGTKVPLKDALRSAFRETAQREKTLEVTLVGPHRDDFDICLSNVLLRKFGSQGQCRTAVIALKLSAVNFIKQSSNYEPILLLDDVFSELDHELCGNLGRLIYGNSQIFIAEPRKDFPITNCGKFSMESGIATENM